MSENCCETCGQTLPDLKYKVGDKVFIEMEVVKLDPGDPQGAYLVSNPHDRAVEFWAGMEHVVSFEREELDEKPEVKLYVEDWTLWTGGECPVEWDTQVEYLLRDGGIYSGFGGNLDWDHKERSYDILQYRLKGD